MYSQDGKITFFAVSIFIQQKHEANKANILVGNGQAVGHVFKQNCKGITQLVFALIHQLFSGETNFLIFVKEKKHPRKPEDQHLYTTHSPTCLIIDIVSISRPTAWSGTPLSGLSIYPPVRCPDALPSSPPSP